MTSIYIFLIPTERRITGNEENCKISVQLCNQKVADLFVYRPAPRSNRETEPKFSRTGLGREARGGNARYYSGDNFLDALGSFRWIERVRSRRGFRDDVSILPSIFSRSNPSPVCSSVVKSRVIESRSGEFHFSIPDLLLHDRNPVPNDTSSSQRRLPFPV